MTQARDDLFSAPDLEGLIAAAKRGSKEALGESLERYGPLLEQRVRKYLGHLVSVNISVPDLVQDMSTAAVKKIRQFRGSSGQELWVWLEHILLHLAQNRVELFRGTKKRDSARVQQLSQNMAERLPARDDDSEGPNGEEEELRWQALWRLSPDHQLVITLHLFQGMPFKDVAKRMGRTPEAVAKLWQRAVQAWRDKVASIKRARKKARGKRNRHGRP